MESNCQSNPGGTGTISGTFQMSNGTYAQTVSEVSASNPDLASADHHKERSRESVDPRIAVSVGRRAEPSVVGHLQSDSAGRAQLLSVRPGLWRTGRQRVGQQLMGDVLNGMSSATLSANSIGPQRRQWVNGARASRTRSVPPPRNLFCWGVPHMKMIVPWPDVLALSHLCARRNRYMPCGHFMATFA